MEMEMNRASSAYPSVMTNSEFYDTWNNTDIKCLRLLKRTKCTVWDTICMPLENQPKGGIFSDEHVFVPGSLQILMVHVILLNIVYLAVHFLLKPFKQSKFVCSVLAGIILRNAMSVVVEKNKREGCSQDINTLNYPVEGLILTQTLGFLGVTLFIFLTAVKMDITMIWRTAKKATIIGILSLFLPFVCVLVLALIENPFGNNKMFPYLFAAGLAVTRFINTAYAFDEMNLLTSKLGQLVMSSTMVHELFTWFILIVGTISFGQVTKKKEFKAGSFGAPGPIIALCNLTYILGLVAFTALIIRPILVFIIKKTPQGKPVKRIFILGILLLVMLMTFMTELIGATHMGALILGLAIPDGPPLGSDLVRSTELFVMNYLMPLFYISVGYNVSLSKILEIGTDCQDTNINIFIISVALASFTKFVGGVIGALASKLSGEHAIIVGLMMNLKGPVDLFLFYRWNARKRVSSEAYAILVFSHVILTAIITALIQRLYKPNYKNMMASDGTKSMREMQTNPSIGEMRILCCVHNNQHVPIFLPLLKASNPTFNSPTSAYVAHLNSLEGRAVPVISHDDRKIRRVHSNRIAFEFEKYAAESKGLVTTKMYTMIAPYKTMHQNIIGLTQEENIVLIVSPFHKNYTAVDINEVDICIFNKNLLNLSPCTVGVLVDKGMSQFTIFENLFSCNIGVLFIGGADDREAVTFATRMIGNPSVNMTLVRLQVSNYYSNQNIDEKVELLVDEAVIHNFRVKSENDKNVVYREIKVETIDEALDGIRTLGSAQNLILVGRQRYVAQSIFDVAMLEWSEHPELGAVGDFIASTDFHGGKTSVLVMQRHSINNEGESHHSLHILESNSSH